MRKSAPIEVVVHYPKTKEGWDELGKRVATAHANYVIEKIDRLNCPTWQKLELYQSYHRLYAAKALGTTVLCTACDLSVFQRLLHFTLEQFQCLIHRHTVSIAVRPEKLIIIAIALLPCHIDHHFLQAENDSEPPLPVHTV